MMKKGILYILSLCLTVCFMLPVNATSDDFWSYSDTVLTITGDIVNFTYNETPWQEYRSDIRTILISGAEEIPEGAFKNLFNVKNVVISSDVTSIGNDAFSGCNKIAAVLIPDTVNSIGTNAFSSSTAICVGEQSRFANQTGYKTYTSGVSNDSDLSDGTSSVSWAVYGNDTLVISGTGDMPNHFGNDANGGVKAPWKDNASQIKTVVIDYGITKTPVFLLNKERTDNTAYSSLQTLVIADSVTITMRDLFGWGGDPACLSRIDLSRNQSSVPQNTLTNTNTVYELFFGKGLSEYGGNAFYSTSSLTKIKLEEGFDGFASDVTSNTIRSANELKEIVFPASVTRIGNKHFFAVRGLEKIVVLNSKTTFGDTAFDVSKTGTETQSGKPTVYCYDNSTAKAWAEKNGFNVTLFDCAYTHGGTTWLMNGETQVEIADGNFSDSVKISNLSKNGDLIANEKVSVSYDFSGGDNWSKIIIAEKTQSGYTNIKTDTASDSTEFIVPSDAYGNEIFAFVFPMNSAGVCGNAKVLSLGIVRNEFDTLTLNETDNKLNGVFSGTYARSGNKTVMAVLCQYSSANEMLSSVIKTAEFKSGEPNSISYENEIIDDKTAKAVLYVWECKNTADSETVTVKSNITAYTTMASVVDCAVWIKQ